MDGEVLLAATADAHLVAFAHVGALTGVHVRRAAPGHPLLLASTLTVFVLEAARVAAMATEYLRQQAAVEIPGERPLQHLYLLAVALLGRTERLDGVLNQRTNLGPGLLLDLAESSHRPVGRPQSNAGRMAKGFLGFVLDGRAVTVRNLGPIVAEYDGDWVPLICFVFARDRDEGAIGVVVFDQLGDDLTDS